MLSLGRGPFICAANCCQFVQLSVSVSLLHLSWLLGCLVNIVTFLIFFFLHLFALHSCQFSPSLPLIKPPSPLLSICLFLPPLTTKSVFILSIFCTIIVYCLWSSEVPGPWKMQVQLLFQLHHWLTLCSALSKFISQGFSFLHVNGRRAKWSLRLESMIDNCLGNSNA